MLPSDDSSAEGRYRAYDDEAVLWQCPPPYSPFIAWLLYLSVLIYGVFLSIKAGIVVDLLHADRTYVSTIILTVFAVATMHAGLRCWYLSRELVLANNIMVNGQQ